MCPFADLLNHSSSSAHTSLSADDFVCHKCGSLRECEHDIQSTSGIVRRLEHLSDKERKRLSAEPDTVDLRVDKRKIRQGDEVYNSYGDNMGDGRLLTEWGFVEEDSTGGIMTFSLEELETGTQQWMEMVQRGEMEWVDRLPVDDEEQLVAPPPDERPLGLTIDTDGVMSVHVFAIILLGRSTTHTSDTVKRGVEELRSAWTASEDETFDEPIEMSRSTFDAVEQVYTLLGKRLASLNRSSLPMEDLYDLRDVSATPRLIFLTSRDYRTKRPCRRWLCQCSSTKDGYWRRPGKNGQTCKLVSCLRAKVVKACNGWSKPTAE